MASVVLVPGFLHGMGREEKCNVLARLFKNESGREYSDGFVLDAPADLPEGDYLVIFDGHALRAIKERGLWFTFTHLSRNAA